MLPSSLAPTITVKGGYCAFPDSGTTVPAASDDPERAAHGTDVAAPLVGNGKAADGGPVTRGTVAEADVWFYATGMPGEECASETAGCERCDPSREAFYANPENPENPEDGESSGETQARMPRGVQ